MHTRSLPSDISQEFYTVKKKLLLPSLLPWYVQRLFLVFFLSYLWIFIQFWSKAVLSHVLGKKGTCLTHQLVTKWQIWEHDHLLASKVSYLIGEKILNKVSVDWIIHIYYSVAGTELFSTPFSQQTIVNQIAQQ